MFQNGEGLSAADIAAVVKENGGDGFGNGNSGWWILLLFLFAMGGWGNNGYGGGNGGLQADLQRGFDTQAISSTLAGINNGLNTGFTGVTAAVTNGFSDAAVARCNNTTTLLQALNNNQAAATNGMNNLAMSLQQCCCDNRAAVADLKYTIATENCADRQAISDGIRDLMAQNTQNTNAIVQSQNAGFQGIQDKLCQMEIDSLKSQNEQLRTQLNMANLAASQNAQTAQIIQDNNAQTAALINRIAPAPIPAYTVANPNGCGCGVGGYTC